MLGFPAEATVAQRVVRFGYRYGSQNTALSGRLRCHVILKDGVRNTFHKTIAKGTGGNTESFIRFKGAYMLDDVGVSSASVN